MAKRCPVSTRHLEAEPFETLEAFPHADSSDLNLENVAPQGDQEPQHVHDETSENQSAPAENGQIMDAMDDGPVVVQVKKTKLSSVKKPVIPIKKMEGCPKDGLSRELQPHTEELASAKMNWQSLQDTSETLGKKCSVTDQDGRLLMYWIDAYESNGTIYLFGKVKV